jgi:hypothetical protein
MTAALVAVTAGCSGDPEAAGAGAGTPGRAAAPGAGAHGSTRESIRAGLDRAGRTAEAELVARERTTLAPLPTPFLGGGQILRVDGTAPHFPRFYVGLAAGRVFALSRDPAAFNRLMSSATVRVDGPDAATRLARTYLEATRDTRTLGYVVGGTRDIVFRPRLSGAEAARRDRIVAAYRSVIAPPKATPAAGGFTVVACTVNDRELRRHTLTVAAGGAVRDKVAVLVRDIPAPYTL